MFVFFSGYVQNVAPQYSGLPEVIGSTGKAALSSSAGGKVTVKELIGKGKIRFMAVVCRIFKYRVVITREGEIFFNVPGCRTKLKKHVFLICQLPLPGR